jgi:prepilin-type N-terminal cleavage/methylation domain-containing protein
VGVLGKDRAREGFTLIELSIVLVIIGLIVAGILVGQNLIHASQVRATITQIQKYQTAVTTFRTKYDALPGDIPSPTNFGLTPVVGSTACAGNLQLDDQWCHGGASIYGNGEVSLFWTHLSSDTHLIEGAYSQQPSGNVVLGATFPILPLGNGIAAFMDGNGQNWFATGVTDVYNQRVLYSDVALTSWEASAIDSKLDDGLPNSGNVLGFFNTVESYASTVPTFRWAFCATGGTPADTYVLNTNSGTSVCNLHIRFQ